MLFLLLGVGCVDGSLAKPSSSAVLSPHSHSPPASSKIQDKKLHHATTAGGVHLLQAAAKARAHVESATSFVQRKIGSKLGEYYHSTRQIYDEIKKIGESCSYMSISWGRAPTSVDNGVKSLMSVRINYEPDDYPNKPERALFIFGEHAREMISPEVGLEFIRRACDPKLLNVQFKNVDTPMIDILKTTEFLIFPNANPHGRRITERGNYCNRVNDRKVDLNRNWGEHWSSKSNHPDTYPGTKAWSEAETVIMAHAASNFLPTIFISIHSGSLHMLSPFAFKGSLAGEPAASTTAIDPPDMLHKSVPADSLAGTGLKPVLQVLKHVNRDFCRCRVGAAGKELGYLCPGTCLDYIYNRVGTRYAFALEIYSGKRYAGPKKSRGSSLIQEEMTLTSLVDVETDRDLEAESFASHADEQGLMELKSEQEFASTASVDLNTLPSFDLPSFTETSSSSVDASLTNDGDVPELSGVIFPRTQRGKVRQCLLGFNPVTKPMYERTVDHWSRALFAFVNSIHSTRPKEE